MPDKRYKMLRKFNRLVVNPIMKLFISGRVSYYAVVRHVGRRSGKRYETPIVAVKKDNCIYAPLPYGADTDWYRNVQAAGQCEVKIMGKWYRVNHPERVETAIAAPAFPEDFRVKIVQTRLNDFLRLRLQED